MRSLKQRMLWAGLLCAAPLAAEVPAAASAPLPKITPDVVQMGAFYSGVQMRIEGLASPGAKVAVVVRGPDTEEVFDKKGRFGPIWINTGKVHISGVPSLFLSYSSDRVENLLDREAIDYHQLDEDAIERQMKIAPKELDLHIIRSDFVALKIQQNVFRVIPDGLRMGRPDASGTPYAVEFHWPRKAPPASYEVRVYEIRDRVVIATSSRRLEVVKIGFPAAMAALSMEHEAFYGIAAILIALLAGFGIDFLVARFRRRFAPAPPLKEAPAEQPSKGAVAGHRGPPGH